MGLNPVTQSYIEYQISQRMAHYNAVQTYRNYAAGKQNLHLTDEQKIMLVGSEGSLPKSDPEFAINVCGIILDVEVDRLEVKSIRIEAGDNEALGDTLSELAWKRWKQSRMDEGQQNAHYASCRDADSFVVPYYDEEKQRTAFAVNQLYDGLTDGADIYYEQDDPAKPLCAVKIWIVEQTQAKTVRRKNVYYPDRVEKWINDGAIKGEFTNAAWRPLKYGDVDYDAKLVEQPSLYQADVTATIVWWTDTGTLRGRPLGIPFFHFRHSARGGTYGRSSIADVAPGLQDAVNRSGLAMMSAAQLSGFKVVTATNFNPDGNTSLEVYPGALLYNEEAGSFGQLSETNLMQLIEVTNSYIKNAATITNTPLSFFNLGGQAPAEGSQKALESGLLAKTRRNQTGFGNTWEDAIRYMLKLESVKGREVTLSWEEIEDLDISIEWESGEVRNELTEAQVAQIHETLGVPRRFIWSLLGYDEDEIAQFEQEADIKRRQAAALLGQAVRDAEQQAQLPPGTAGSNGNGANAGTDRTASPAGAGVGT